jgi:hypothetical protein
MRFQLRMYRVRSGEMDEWIQEWREHVLPLRRAHGFSVVGPWVRREEDLFVWLIGHREREAANASYYASPARRSLDPDPARHLAETNAWIVESLEESGDVDDDAEGDQAKPEQQRRLEP